MAISRGVPGSVPAPFNPVAAGPVAILIARPESDAFLGAWVDELGGSVNIYQSIDEVIASDTDYISSEGDPVTSPYVTGLSEVTNPEAAEGDQTVRYRYRKPDLAAAQVDLTVELREGYVDESTKGALIASQVHEDVPADVFIAGSFVLEPFESSLIVDYSDLYLRFVADAP